MRVMVLSFVVALPRVVYATPPRTPLTLSEVSATAPDATVTVNCRCKAWPTLRQVTRDLGHDDPEPLKPLRRHILKEGRQACDAGATHVLVQFYRGRDREVAMQLDVAP